MNIVSFLLIAIISFSTIRGMGMGFYITFARLLSWVGCLLLTLFLYPYVAELWEKIWGDNRLTFPLSFFFSLLVTGLLLSFLFNSLLKRIPLKAHKNPINKISGILPGAVMGIFYAAIVSLLFLAMPFSERLYTLTRESKIAQQVTLKLEQVEDSLKPALKGFIDRSMQVMTIEEGTEASIKLPFSVKDPKVREDLEKEMLDMVNTERNKHGLTPLQPDSQLTAVARKHCRDMFSRSYFSHISPEGFSPLDRLREANIRFRRSGENLALSQTLLIAHEGLMNSPGHRANILRASFKRAGIGILDGGIFGLMVTQVFKN